VCPQSGSEQLPHQLVLEEVAQHKKHSHAAKQHIERGALDLRGNRAVTCENMRAATRLISSMTKKSLLSGQRHFQRLQSLKVDRPEPVALCCSRLGANRLCKVLPLSYITDVAPVGVYTALPTPHTRVSQVNDMSCKLLLAHTWTAMHEHQWGSRLCLVSAALAGCAAFADVRARHDALRSCPSVITTPLASPSACSAKRSASDSAPATPP
jgi:hypothetical protein